MKKIEMYRTLTSTRVLYRVDGKRASIKTTTQAEKDNHREIVESLFGAYEKAHGVESIPVKSTDFNPRANNGVFVVTIFAEFAWRYVPSPKGSDTDELQVKRGYKNLADAVDAAKYVQEHLGRDFYNNRRRFTGALILKDCGCYWQVLYRRGKEIILTPKTNSDI